MSTSQLPPAYPSPKKTKITTSTLPELFTHHNIHQKINDLKVKGSDQKSLTGNNSLASRTSNTTSELKEDSYELNEYGSSDKSDLFEESHDFNLQQYQKELQDKQNLSNLKENLKKDIETLKISDSKINKLDRKFNDTINPAIEQIYQQQTKQMKALKTKN